MTARILWLRCDNGRVTGASVDDVILLLELLELPPALRQQAKLTPSSPGRFQAVSVMRPTGLHVVLPATLGTWILNVSRRTDAEMLELRHRLESWLAGESETCCCATRPVGMTGNFSTTH